MNERVRIAQDALAQLKGGQLYATTGRYIAPDVDLDRSRATAEQLTALPCGVCAQGALIIGMLEKDEPLGDMDDRFRQLEDAFGYEQAQLIEDCFEGCSVKSNNALAIYEDYRERFYDNAERLEAILQNIVRNDGTFIPEQDL